MCNTLFYHLNLQRRVNPTSQFEEADRQWRKTWLRDLNLTARDRAYNTYENPEYYKATNHVFRCIPKLTRQNKYKSGHRRDANSVLI